MVRNVASPAVERSAERISCRYHDARRAHLRLAERRRMGVKFWAVSLAVKLLHPGQQRSWTSVVGPRQPIKKLDVERQRERWRGGLAPGKNGGSSSSSGHSQNRPDVCTGLTQRFAGCLGACILFNSAALRPPSLKTLGFGGQRQTWRACYGLRPIKRSTCSTSFRIASPTIFRREAVPMSPLL